jgi:hypothetical protein
MGNVAEEVFVYFMFTIFASIFVSAMVAHWMQISDPAAPIVYHHGGSSIVKKVKNIQARMNGPAEKQKGMSSLRQLRDMDKDEVRRTEAVSDFIDALMRPASVSITKARKSVSKTLFPTGTQSDSNMEPNTPAPISGGLEQLPNPDEAPTSSKDSTKSDGKSDVGSVVSSLSSDVGSVMSSVKSGVRGGIKGPSSPLRGAQERVPGARASSNSSSSDSGGSGGSRQNSSQFRLTSAAGARSRARSQSPKSSKLPPARKPRRPANNKPGVELV